MAPSPQVWRPAVDDPLGNRSLHPAPGLAVGQELGVTSGFPAGHPRLVAKLEATEPFDVQIALKPRHDQPDRKPVSRPMRLAILAVGDYRLVHDLTRERDASVDARPVAALRRHPIRSAILTDKIDQESERNPRPLVGADQSMRVLHG